MAQRLFFISRIVDFIPRARPEIDDINFLPAELIEPESCIVRPAQVPSCKYCCSTVGLKIHNSPVELKTVQRFGSYGARNSGVEAAEIFLEPDAFAITFPMLRLEFSEIGCEFFFRDEVRVVTGEYLREPVRFRFGQFTHVVEMVLPSRRRNKDRPSFVFSQNRSEIGTRRRIGQGVLGEDDAAGA